MDAQVCKNGLELGSIRSGENFQDSKLISVIEENESRNDNDLQDSERENENRHDGDLQDSELISVIEERENASRHDDDLQDSELISVIEERENEIRNDDELLGKEMAEEETTKHEKPFWFCRFVTTYPIMSFILGVSGHLFIGAVTIILLLVGFDVFPTNFETLPMELRDSPWLARYRAYQNRFNFKHPVHRYVKGDYIPTWIRGNEGMRIELIYDTHGKNIFTKEHLQTIASIEKKVDSIPEYSDISYNTNETKVELNYLLAKDFKISPSFVSSSLTRSEFPLGWPISNDFNEDIAAKIVRSKQVKYLKPVFEEIIKTKDFDVTYFSLSLFEHDVAEQAIKDLYLAGGSVIFIFCYMWFHTSSLWITVWSVISILSSFLATNLFYRVILDFRYFGFFHVLSLFIILGIGADDLFVFYDFWRATGLTSYPSLAHRLSSAYRKSTLSMFVTSVTTMAAFASTALTPLLATKSFGIFSAVLIIIDYISVIIFFPTIVIFYHVKIKKCCTNFCSCCLKNTKESTQITDNLIDNDFCQNEVTETVVKKQPGMLVRFFRDKYFKFVTHGKIRWILISGFAVLVLFMLISCSRLKPDNEQIQFFKKNHNYGKAANYRANSFLPDAIDYPLSLTLLWGLKEQDLSSCHFSDVKCKGTVHFDDNFDPNSVEAQKSYQKLCDKLYNMSEEESRRLKVKRHLLTNKPVMHCFAKNLNEFLKLDTQVTGLDTSLPWDYNKTRDFVKMRSPLIYNITGMDLTSVPVLDIAISFWLYNRFLMNQTKDYKFFNGLIGEQEGPYSTSIIPVPNVKVGNKIKSLSIELILTINPLTTGFKDGITLVEAWEDFMIEQKSTMPASLQGGFQVGWKVWHWFYVQRVLYENAIMGILLGLGLTTIILLISIQNIITSLLASVTIVMVTICVIGVIPLLGWKLGVLVSLNMCLVVGLSVDYVVHLAEGYTMSKHKDRKSRVQDSLETMATSVYSGACTTLGASVFMLFSQIIFFFQFGIFRFFTIGFSILFSLGLFITLMGTIGPENDTGDIKAIFRKVRNFVLNRGTHCVET
ncbi:protein dispatched homolog 3 [Patella vulgata]|uniref:protein dispatched homolog 3 n=1 Tax=Patella vulgata TaxID=6465 RepID=UPI0024A951FD|nr:protein dispatched homolog 3 [Patella vulgata]